MNDVECPYCGAELEINHDDSYGYEEDKTHDQECSECEKTFVYQTSIHFSYDASKADCLNGGEHKYKLTTTYPPEFARMRCDDCGHETPKVKVANGKVSDAPDSAAPNRESKL